MATDNDISQAAASIYAESLMQLADEAGKADEIGAELTELRQLWNSSPEFAAMMSSAAIDDDARRESIKKAFGNGRVSPMVLNLMLVLNDRWRSMIFAWVCDAYQQKLNERRGRETANVTSAVALNDAQRDKVKAEVKRLTGLDAILNEKVDPSLIGGLRIQIRDRLYDMTVQRRLRKMRSALHDAGERLMRDQAARFVTEGQ
jgi:ATP synthase F1 delta subunit